MAKIALSPDNVEKVTADFMGDQFTFGIRRMTIDERCDYENMITQCIEDKTTLADIYKKRWDFSIVDCSLENPLGKIPASDIKKILDLVDEVNVGIAEKES